MGSARASSWGDSTFWAASTHESVCSCEATAWKAPGPRGTPAMPAVRTLPGTTPLVLNGLTVQDVHPGCLLVSSVQQQPAGLQGGAERNSAAACRARCRFFSCVLVSGCRGCKKQGPKTQELGVEAVPAMKGEDASPEGREHERSGWMPTRSISLSNGVLYLQVGGTLSQTARLLGSSVHADQGPLMSEGRRWVPSKVLRRSAVCCRGRYAVCMRAAWQGWKTGHHHAACIIFWSMAAAACAPRKQAWSGCLPPAWVMPQCVSHHQQTAPGQNASQLQGIIHHISMIPTHVSEACAVPGDGDEECGAV